MNHATPTWLIEKLSRPTTERRQQLELPVPSQRPPESKPEPTIIVIEVL